MKYLIAAILALAAFRPAAAADLTVMEPADHSVLRGTVQFRIRAQEEPGERFLKNPEVSIRDEFGKQVASLRPYRDAKSLDVCQATLDTTALKDGLYLISVLYQNLKNDKIAETREELSLGVRNGKTQPAKLFVALTDKPYRTGDPCEFTVVVVDVRGKRMPAARVAYQVDQGELSTAADVSDSHGEAAGVVDSSEARTVTLTVTAEGLPPVTKTIRFVER